MKTEWIIKDFDKELASEIAYECELPRPIANILISRGIDTKEEIIKFIEVQLNQLQKLPELIITVNPENLKKIRAACKRLISQNNLKIQIHIKQYSKC